MLLSISHQVKPERQGNGGYIVSSRLGIGSASARPVWSGMLFSLEVFHNPYFSDSLPLTLIGEIEKTGRLLSHWKRTPPINQEEYKEHFDLRKRAMDLNYRKVHLSTITTLCWKSCACFFISSNKCQKVSSYIGAADEATALFTVYWSTE